MLCFFSFAIIYVSINVLHSSYSSWCYLVFIGVLQTMLLTEDKTISVTLFSCVKAISFFL